LYIDARYDKWPNNYTEQLTDKNISTDETLISIADEFLDNY
jgi:hypothetical protein